MELENNSPLNTQEQTPQEQTEQELKRFISDITKRKLYLTELRCPVHGTLPEDPVITILEDQSISKIHSFGPGKKENGKEKTREQITFSSLTKTCCQIQEEMVLAAQGRSNEEERYPARNIQEANTRHEIRLYEYEIARWLNNVLELDKLICKEHHVRAEFPQVRITEFVKAENRQEKNNSEAGTKVNYISNIPTCCENFAKEIEEKRLEVAQALP